MSPLFGNRAEKDAQEAAASAESERLASPPVAELAAEIMPAFGPDGLATRSGHRQGAVEISTWLPGSGGRVSDDRFSAL